jgi:hypothetical protein
MRIYALQLQMKKRHSKEASFFCLPEELQRVLDPILARAGAQLCVAEKEGGYYYLRKATLPNELKELDPQFYAYVLPLAGDRGLSSLANLVQVWFPVLEDRRLRLGRIAMLVMESDIGEEHRMAAQEGIFRDARKALTKNFRRGVLGRNSKTGGEHFYKDIFISDQAARAYQDGVVLASLLGDGFVTYHVNTG